MVVSITIGAALSAGFRTALGGAEKTLDSLGKTVEALTAKQKLLGKAIQDGLFVRKNVDGLQAQYDRVGKAIERAATHHRRLNELMRQGAALRDARGQLRGEMMDAGATALAVGAPSLKAVRLAGGFEDQLRDIAITGEMSRGEEARLGASIRENALRFNQAQDAVAAGLGVLVAGGISSAEELTRFAPVLAKAATATRADVGELGAVLLAMRDNLHIAAKDSESSLNMLAYAGKKGQFEIRDMAKWLPSLAPQMAALGVTGKEAVAEIGAALQVARKGAGSNDEAANNLRNFLAKVTSPDTIKDFSKAGIDLQADLVALRAQGLTPLQGMLQLITNYMGTKGPEAAKELKKALALKDDSERQAALDRLREAYKLGELFQDLQAMNFIKPALANAKEMGDIKSGALAAGDADLLGADFAKRMEGFNEQSKAFAIQARELGIVVGSALLPPLSALIKTATPVVALIGQAAGAFPRLTATVIGLATGLTLGKVAFLACSFAVNTWRSTLVVGQTVALLFSGKLAILRGALLMGAGAARAMAMALVASPIGAIVAAIAVSALLIYKYWDPISGWFRQAWADVKAECTRVWPFFESLPGKFKAWGSEILSGLIAGIKAKIGEVKDAIVGVGSSVKGWFADTLGIKSPSRVFMGMGDMVGEGLRLGMLGKVPGVQAAGKGLAAATMALSLAGQGPASPTAGPGRLPAAGGQGATHITYAPVINVAASAPDEVRQQVDQALKLSQAEFEKMLARAGQNKARKGFV